MLGRFYITVCKKSTDWMNLLWENDSASTVDWAFMKEKETRKSNFASKKRFPSPFDFRTSRFPPVLVPNTTVPAFSCADMKNSGADGLGFSTKASDASLMKSATADTS